MELMSRIKAQDTRFEKISKGHYCKKIFQNNEMNILNIFSNLKNIWISIFPKKLIFFLRN